MSGTKTNTPAITITVAVELDIEMIFNALMCAFEGGSAYWARRPASGATTQPMMAAIEDFMRERGISTGPRTHSTIIYCLIPLFGGRLIVEEYDPDDGKKIRNRSVNLATIQRALCIMARDYRTHFEAIRSDNCDAEAGDVLFQLAALGELVYG